MEVAPASAVGLEQNSFFLDQTWHVLLCDDDPIVLKAVGLLLNKSGYRVTTANSGREALQVLEASKMPGAMPIDLVVTDLQMPELSGFDLLHEVLTGTSDVPIVVMSSSSDQAAVLQAFEAGAADYLIKPLRRNEVATLWQHVWRANRYKASVQHAAQTAQVSGYANNHYVPQAPASGGNADGNTVMAPVDHHRAAAHHPQNPATKAAAAAVAAGSLPAATGKNGSSGASTSHVDQGSTMITSAAARGTSGANKANATANNSTLLSTDPSHTGTHTAYQSTHQSGVHDSHHNRMAMRSQTAASVFESTQNAAEASASAAQPAKHSNKKPSHRDQGVACACVGPDCMDVDHDVDDDDDDDDDAEGRATSPITQEPIEGEQQLLHENQGQSRANKHQERQQQQQAQPGHVAQQQAEPSLQPASESHLHPQQQQQQHLSQQQQDPPSSAIFSAAHSMRTSFDGNTHQSTGRQSLEYNAASQSKSRRRSSTSMAVVGAGPSTADPGFAAAQLPLALQELASIGLQRLDLTHNSSNAEASTATGTIIGGSVVSAARACESQALSQQTTQHRDAAEHARLEAERLKREQDELETAEAAGLLLGVAAAAAAEQEAARHAAHGHKSSHGRNHGGRRGEGSNGGHGMHRSGSTNNQLSHSSRSAFSALTVILPRKASGASNGKAEQSQSQHTTSGMAIGTPAAPIQNSSSHKSPMDTNYDAVSPNMQPPFKLQPGKSQKGSSKLPDNIASEGEAKQQPLQQRSPGHSPGMTNTNATPGAALDNAAALPLTISGSGPLPQQGDDMMPATGVPASGHPMYPMPPQHHLMLPQAVMPLLAYSFAGLPPEMAAMYMASAAQHAAQVHGQPPHSEHQQQDAASYMEGMQHVGASHMAGMPGCATSMMASGGGAPPAYPSVVVVAGRGTGCGLSNMSSSAVAHRKAAVARYLQKKKNRSFKKKVRYESRKRLAEARPRVRGQFVKQDVLLAMAGSAGSGSLPPAADSNPSGSSGTSAMGRADNAQHQKQQHAAMADMQSDLLPQRSSARVQARKIHLSQSSVSPGGSGGKRQRLRRVNTQDMEDVGHEEEDDDVDDDNDDMQQASDDDDMDDDEEPEPEHA